MKNNCFLCGYDADYDEDSRDISYFNCPRCGKYGITMEAESDLKGPAFVNIIYILSGITRYRTENNFKPILITRENYDFLKDEFYVPRNLKEKLDLLLYYISKKSKYVGSPVEFDFILDYPLAFSKNYDEFSNFFKILIDKDFLNKFSAGQVYILTELGWNYLENKKNEVTIKDQAFIAMWFSEDLIDVYENGFRKAIKDTDYKPMRVDLKEHNNKIDDEIIAEIKNSAFLIADFTGQRGGVYFEAGFAKGLGIPVIWTCKKNDMKNLHFDTRQFNHIEWNDSSDLFTKLVNRIKATIK